jgi:hypothetical protein
MNGALALAVIAAAATAATPVVPLGSQANIERTAPAVAYVPTRMGFGFVFHGWEIEQGALHVWFRNKAGRQITFVALRKAGDCTVGREKTFQLAGNKVYWSHTATAQQAWRCVAGPTGQVRLVAVTGLPPTQFADAGLGRVVASAHRVP